MEMQWTQSSQNNLEKNRVKELTLADLKTIQSYSNVDGVVLA